MGVDCIELCVVEFLEEPERGCIIGRCGVPKPVEGSHGGSTGVNMLDDGFGGVTRIPIGLLVFDSVPV